MADTDPVPPFGANIAGVKALVPQAPIPETLGPGDRGVTAAQVSAWLESLSQRVDLALSGWRRLRAEANAEEQAAGEEAPRARLVSAAADLVHQGAASYLEAARFPERAGKADAAYADVLWARFTEGLDLLAVWLEEELADAGAGNVVEPGPDGTGGAAWSFPAASFTPETMRW